MIETIIPAFVPVISDAIRGLFNRFTGNAGAKPANVNEVVQLMEADTKRLEALAKIDTVSNTSEWVNNIRALMRPVSALLIIAIYMLVIIDKQNMEIIAMVGTYAQMVTFYLFGDRTYLHIKGKA